MTPSEILAHLADRTEKREEAAGELYKLLSRRIKSPLPMYKRPDFIQVDPRIHEDVVQGVILKVLDKGRRLSVFDKDDAKIAKYLYVMMSSLALTHYRGNARFVTVEDIGSFCTNGNPGAADDARLDLAAIMDLMKRVHSHVKETVPTRYHRNNDAAYEELWRLRLDIDGMDRILTEHAGQERDEVTAKEWEQVRARVLTAHHRIRGRISEGVDAMEAAGQLSCEEAKMARQVLESLNRCKKTEEEPVEREDGG